MYKLVFPQIFCTAAQHAPGQCNSNYQIFQFTYKLSLFKIYKIGGVFKRLIDILMEIVCILSLKKYLFRNFRIYSVSSYCLTQSEQFFNNISCRTFFHVLIYKRRWLDYTKHILSDNLQRMYLCELKMKDSVTFVPY